MLLAIDAALEALQKGTTMNTTEMFEAFGEFDPSQYEDEVRQRWGDSDAYRESMRRTGSYSKQQWQQINAEGDEIDRGFTERLAAGALADDPAVMDLAERHRLRIDRWFYPCGRGMHAHLGEMYVTDPRFSARYEQMRPGLAGFVRDAFRANAARSDESVFSDRPASTP